MPPANSIKTTSKEIMFEAAFRHILYFRQKQTGVRSPKTKGVRNSEVYSLDTFRFGAKSICVSIAGLSKLIVGGAT